MGFEVLEANSIQNLIEHYGADAFSTHDVFVLGFEAIRDRSGDRWAIRQDMVREFIERRFQKHFPVDHQLLRLDDVNFLLVQPGETGFGAKTRALKLLSEVLQYFLGASTLSDVRLSRVTRASADGLEITDEDVSATDFSRLVNEDWDIPSPDVANNLVQRPVLANDAPTGPALRVIDNKDRRGAIGLRRDRNYEAIFLTEPIWTINQRAIVSYLLRPLIFERQDDCLVEAEANEISPGDRIGLDLVVLAEAERLFREHGPKARFALHVPISQASLSTAAGRRILRSALERLQPLASASIIFVVTGLEAGAPHSKIITITSALAGQCRGVIALAPDLDCKSDHWRGAHLSGVAVSLDGRNSSSELSVGRFSEFADRLAGVAPALMAYSVPNRAALIMAWSAGFTHVGGEPIQKYADDMLEPLRLNPIQLY